MADQKTEVGALWKKISKKGNAFYTGDIDVPGGGTIKIIAFDNDRKQKETQPDIRIYLQEENGGGYSGGGNSSGGNYSKPAPTSRPAPVQATLTKDEAPGYHYPTAEEEGVDPADIPF